MTTPEVETTTTTTTPAIETPKKPVTDGQTDAVTEETMRKMAANEKAIKAAEANLRDAKKKFEAAQTK